MQVTIGAHCWDGVRTKKLNYSHQDHPQIEQTIINKTRWINNPKVRSVIGFAVPMVLLASGFSSFAFASMSPEVIPAMAIPEIAKKTITSLFDPLIQLIVTLSYPIAGVMIAGGCLFIMVGNRDRGMQMLQNAAIGYILVQLSPMMLNLLVGIGNSV